MDILLGLVVWVPWFVAASFQGVTMHGRDMAGFEVAAPAIPSLALVDVHREALPMFVGGGSVDETQRLNLFLSGHHLWDDLLLHQLLLEEERGRLGVALGQ